MQSQAKYIIAQSAVIPSFINWMNRDRLLVLTYHGIYDGPRKNGALPETFVHIQNMAKQLNFIKKRYRVIDAEELVTSLDTRYRLPPHAALITFDDGYESFYRLAYPALKSLGIRAIVFISSEYVEYRKPFWFDLVWLFLKHSSYEKIAWLCKILGVKDRLLARSELSSLCLERMKRMQPEPRDAIMSEISEMMSTKSSTFFSLKQLFYAMSGEQLKKLATSGTSFGGHTHSHSILSALPASLAKKEVVQNKKSLETIINIPCELFAYPNGDTRDFTNEHKTILRSAGYKGAFSLTQKRCLIHDDPMDISRINVSTEDTLRSLTFRCTGINPIIDRIRNYMGAGC
jgi:peptidoglycan/xylan/chitin deacetylase (PgdA/CDA1 family)